MRHDTPWPSPGDGRLATPLLGQAGPARGGIGSWLVLFALVLFLVPSRFTFGPYEPLTAALAVGAVLCVLWLAGKLAPQPGTTPRRQVVTTAVALFLGVMAVSYAWANAQPITSQQAQDSMRNLLDLVVLCGVGFAAAQGLRSRVELDRLLATMVGAAGVMALIGIVQFTTGTDVARWLKPPGFTAHGIDSFISSRGGVPRVMGTTRHPIEFAVMCAAMIPIGIHVALHGRTPGVRQIAGLSTAAMALALPMGFSRTGVAALAVVVVMVLPVLPGRVWFRLGAAAALVMVVIVLAFPEIISGFDALRTGEEGQGSITGRATHQSMALELASEAPWFGYGFGTENPDVRGFVIDNTYVVMLLETGWVGATAFVGMFIVAIATAWAIRRRNRDPATRDLAQMLAAGLAGIAVSGWGFHILRFNSAAALTFLLLGVVAALARLPADEARTVPTTWLPYAARPATRP